MRWNERPREVVHRPPWGFWLAIGCLFAVAGWLAYLADENRRAVDALRVQVRGLPQVVHSEMDCGCVGGCRCCTCGRD